MSGTATAGSDYISLSGTVTIAAGSTTADIDVAVLDDVLVEGTETVVVTLSSITSGNPGISIAAANTATLNIADNNVAPMVSLTAPANASTTTNMTPTFSGSAGILSGNLATVTVKIYQGSTTTGTLVQTLTTTRNAITGAYSVLASSTLPPGIYTAQAQQSDSAGNIGFSSANTFSIQFVPPEGANLTISSVTNPIKPANQTHVSASGKATAGATVRLVILDAFGHWINAGTKTVGVSGKWSFSGINVASLRAGKITYKVTATLGLSTSTLTRTATKVAGHSRLFRPGNGP